jgi:carbon monoxide dehydrogenase subunit G
VTLNGVYRIPAPRERVFAALVDPAVLQRCIEGAEQLVAISEDEYKIHLKIGLAALRGSYSGKVRIADKEPPAHFTLHVEGKGTPGFVRGSARIGLEEQNGGTELTCATEGQVGGLLAAVGSRLVEAAARKMMDGFFQRLIDELTN